MAHRSWPCGTADREHTHAKPVGSCLSVQRERIFLQDRNGLLDRRVVAYRFTLPDVFVAGLSVT